MDYRVIGVGQQTVLYSEGTGGFPQGSEGEPCRACGHVWPSESSESVSG